jgi:hypothetical protein
MIDMKKIATFAALASALTIGAADAQHYRGAACTLFEHADYGGEALAMGPDDAVSFRAGQFWNDRASSARVARGCTLVIYEHTRMQGDSAEIHRRARNLGDGWNDRMSSAECFCDSYDDDY